MAAGLEVPDHGQIVKQNGLKIAYLSQDPEFPKGATILSYIQDDENVWKVQSNLQELRELQIMRSLFPICPADRRRSLRWRKYWRLILMCLSSFGRADEPSGYPDDGLAGRVSPEI